MTDIDETVWEVDYRYITNIMEMPIQCMIDISEKVDQFIEMAEDLSKYLNIAEEEYVHPLIDKEGI
jgi:hypothetical protein